MKKLLLVQKLIVDKASVSFLSKKKCCGSTFFPLNAYCIIISKVSNLKSFNSLESQYRGGGHSRMTSDKELGVAIQTLV